MTNNQAFFTARRYASAVYAIVLCPSVARRYCTKRLNVGSYKQRRTITQGLYFRCQRSRRNSKWFIPTSSL